MSKILFVLHNSDITSGATNSMSQIISQISDMELYQISVLLPTEKGEAKKYFDKLGIEVYVLPYKNLFFKQQSSLISKIIRFPLYFSRLVKTRIVAGKFAKDKKYDIVYTNTSTTVIGGYIGKACGAKQIWHFREFRLIDHRMSFFLGDGWLMRFVSSCFDRIVCVSQCVRDYHLRFFPETKMVVSYNNYPVSYIREKLLSDFDAEELRVLVSGVVRESKGQLIVLQALNMLVMKGMSFHLTIAGMIDDPEYYHSMNEYIVSNNLENNVLFTGHVNSTLPYREKCQIGIVSSVNEALGRTTAEGMLCGMVMVGRNSGGTLEQIMDGETGCLYDGTAEDLAKVLESLYKNRSLCKTLSLKGKQWSEDRFTKGYATQIVAETIDEVLNEKR